MSDGIIYEPRTWRRNLSQYFSRAPFFNFQKYFYSQIDGFEMMDNLFDGVQNQFNDDLN